MEFKDRLKKLRKENKMTQTELGKRLNYGYTAISNYETGRNEPGIKELIALADIFNVSVDYLIGRVDLKTKASDKMTKCGSCIKCDVCYLGTNDIECPYFVSKD
ncbi:MAG: helix-turn-helix domain-containing protein [Clostridia bacterium]|jgi:transcriptional regulator with XRE-family HTH domain|nr:helix-turn-helix domain-containing protein [Clostridia bacterium]MCI2014046.1 helix-turn-helix domain-containing protein [Clostridia bacterium]